MYTHLLSILQSRAMETPLLRVICVIYTCRLRVLWVGMSLLRSFSLDSRPWKYSVPSTHGEQSGRIFTIVTFPFPLPETQGLSFFPSFLPSSFLLFLLFWLFNPENLLELQRGNAQNTAASRSFPRPVSLHSTSSILPSSSGEGSGAGPAAETNPAGWDSPVSAAWGVAVGPAPAAAASVLPWI